MDREKSAHNEKQDFASLAREHLEHSWRLLQENAAFLRLFEDGEGESGTAAINALLQEMEQQFNKSVDELQRQKFPPAVFIETLKTACLQLNAMQTLFDGMPASTSIGRSMLQNLPRLGPMQRRQERLEAAGEALEGYLEAQRDYAGLLRRINEEALTAVRTRLESTSDPMDMQRFYDLWLETCEATYEEAINSDDYARSIGQLGNAFSRLMLHGQDLMEELLQAFNLPTRADLRSTQRRLHDIRRRHYELAERIDPDEFYRLKQEVSELREAVAALQDKRESGRKTTGRASRRAVDSETNP